MDIFIVPIKSDDVYVDITEHTEKIVDASKYKDDRPLHTGKSLKQKSYRVDERWIRWKKQWTKLLPLRPKMYSYLMIMLTRKKSGKEKCFIKLEIKFQRVSEENYKECLENNKTILQHRSKC